MCERHWAAVTPSSILHPATTAVVTANGRVPPMPAPLMRPITEDEVRPASLCATAAPSRFVTAQEFCDLGDSAGSTG